MTSVDILELADEKTAEAEDMIKFTGDKWKLIT